MKNFIQKLWAERKGSVSIFFIIITLVVFIFHAILIDVARIMAAEQQTEYALQSAVRSTLAAFDSDLQTNYGLFGIKKENVDFFDDLLIENLQAPAEQQEGFFDLLNIKVEDTSLEYDRYIVDPEILKHQILEEMKYKAPVEIVKELLQKFTFVSETMKETSKFIDVASDINDDFKKREKLLDEIEELLEKNKKRLEKLEKQLSDQRSSKIYPEYENVTDIITFLSDLSKMTEDIESKISNAEKELEEKEEEVNEIEKEIREIELKENKSPEDKERLKQLKKDLKKIKKEIKNLEEALEEYINDLGEKVDEIEELKEKTRDFFENLYGESLNMYNDLMKVYDKSVVAKKLNKKIRKRIKKANEDADKDYNQAIKHSEPPLSNVDQEELNNSLKNLEEMTEELDNYIYDDKFFVDMEKFSRQTSIYAFEISRQAGKVDFHFYISEETINELVTEIRPNLNETKKYFNKTYNYFFDEDNGRKDYGEDSEKDNEKDADKKNKEMKEQIDDIDKLVDSIEKDKEIYDELSKTLEDLKEFLEGQANDESEIDKMEYKSRSKDSAKGAMKLMNNLFKGLGNILASARNELYINEYILHRFESATPKNGFMDKSQFSFDHREVEYIIYGFHTPGMNYSAAIGQVSALCFALNFIGALSDKKIRVAGHPLFTFFLAATKALELTIQDIDKLGKGNEVVLIPNITPGIEFSYNDFLRVILFMNPGGEERLMRVATVANYRTESDFRERPSFITGEVESSIRLWFLPEIANLLNKTGVLSGRVEGNRFHFKNEAHFSY